MLHDPDINDTQILYITDVHELYHVRGTQKGTSAGKCKTGFRVYAVDWVPAH